MQNDINSYLNNGFTDTPVNNSGLGARVLQSGGVVVKFGLDSAYDLFIKYVLKNANSKNLPLIYRHDLPKGPFPVNCASLAYTRTEMEILDELTPNEAKEYDIWIAAALALIINNKPVLTDPFGLLDETKNLVAEAKKIGVMLDLNKSKNIMKRPSTGEYVHIDPFN